MTVLASSADTGRPAQAGEQLEVGTQIQTGANGHLSFMLQPEGSIVHLGPNSIATLKNLSSDARGQADVRILLDSGRIWVLPKGGQLLIKTSLGMSSTTGSPMGVNYDPEPAYLQSSCLEGLCSLKNDEGEIILTSGMMATILDGHLPYSSEQMNGEVLQEWVNENPDLESYFGGKLPGWLVGIDPTPGD